MRHFLIFFIVLSFLSSAIFARGAKQRIIVDLNYGMSYINPSDINDKILDDTTGVALVVPDISGISWAHNMGLSVSYSFSYKYSIGLTSDFIFFRKFIGESFDSIKIFYPEASAKSGKYYELNTDVMAYGFGPIFTYFIYNSGKIDVSATAGLLYYLSFKYIQDTTYGNSSTDANLDSNVKQIEGTGSTWGGTISVSGNYYFTNYLALGLNLGYKYIKAPSLVDSAGNPINFTWLDGTEDSPTSPISIPIGGPFIALNLKFDFNIGKGLTDDKSNKSSEDDSDVEFVDESNIDNDINSFEDSSIENSNSTVSSFGTETNIEELYKLKRKANVKYRYFKRKRKYRCSRRMKKLYNIINEIESYQWKRLNDDARQEKLEKINKILSSC